MLSANILLISNLSAQSFLSESYFLIRNNLIFMGGKGGRKEENISFLQT